MNASLVMGTCIALCTMIFVTANGAQDVGGDFGTSWLAQHGTQFPSAAETQNSLWNWGNAPKGFTLTDGKVIPPGYGTQLYYPSLPTNGTPIILNSTASVGSDYFTPNFQPSIPEGAWIQAQLTGRPIAIINTPYGSLF